MGHIHGQPAELLLLCVADGEPGPWGTWLAKNTAVELSVHPASPFSLCLELPGVWSSAVRRDSRPTRPYWLEEPLCHSLMGLRDPCPGVPTVALSVLRTGESFFWVLGVAVRLAVREGR